MNIQAGHGSVVRSLLTGTPALGAPALALRPARQIVQATASDLSVLLVDDEGEVLAELVANLSRRGLNVLPSESAEAALAVLRRRPEIATLVSDIRMPGMDGLALAEAALRGRAEAQALEVVLITGYASAAQGMAAARIGAFGMLHKPMRGAELARMVQDALARAALRRGILGNAIPAAWTRRPTSAAALAPIPAPPPRFARAPSRRAGPAPAAPAAATSADPASAAEALLHALAQRVDAAGNGVEAVAQDLRGPLGDLLRAIPRTNGGGVPTQAAGLLALLDELMDLAELEDGTAQPQRTPISAHGLLGLVSSGLGGLGLRCGRRLILQPDADPAFNLDGPRLVRAMALLAALTLGQQPVPAKASGSQPALPAGAAELSVDAGAGQARLDLVIRPSAQTLRRPEVAETEQRLRIAIARRLVALQGGRLDVWTLPDRGLRARLLLRSA
ncbi:response regulator [Falsiroseomonas sp. E2-1-a20]|uniref:response regulator n=1 Tax=Falsiroseomonas sp. E2-1-a20 TaxID=3239300 RepID=UPI003F2C847F